jgi:translation elongation factor EF-4
MTAQFTGRCRGNVRLPDEMIDLPRFYFHLHELGSLNSDCEGSVLFDSAAAHVEALRIAREMTALEMRTEGVVRLDRRIEICDADARQLEIVEFDQAITVEPRS